MRFGHLRYRPSRPNSQESGYMLIIVVFLVTVLVISMLAMTASMKEQVQRDREDEMIHRGVQYARAIKKYYKKFGAYPATLEALEDTNHVRYLRKKYKDPLTKDGKWTLVRYGQIQMGTQGGAGFTNSGQPGLPNVPGVTSMLQGQGSTSSFGQSSTGQSSFGQSSFGQSSFGQNSSFGQSSFGQNQQPAPFAGPGGSQVQMPTSGVDQNGATTNIPTGVTNDNSGTSAGATTPQGATTPGTPGALGTSGSTSSFGQTATGLTGTGPMGGGAIVGVASTSPKQSLRIVNQKNHYKDWVFVYDPMLDRGLIKGPYDPKKMAIGQQQQVGVPAGQAGNSGSSSSGNGFGNSSFGNSSFGNSSFGNSSFGNSSFGGSSFGGTNSGFGQQQQQPAQPSQPNQP
jgi:hypothetical protein